MKRIYRNLDFDDVLIKPIPSQVNSREEVDISVKLSDNFTLQFPLIASPMRGIVDANFASALSDLGGIAILHRFYNSKDELYSESNTLLQTNKNFGMSIGLNDNDYISILDRYQPKILVVDVANGYTESLLCFCEEIKKYIISNNLNTLLCSGNVCTVQGVENLRNSGVDIVRFGIGCFTKGTRILLSNGTYKNIEDMIIGDRIINKNGNPATVKNVIYNGKKNVRKIKTNHFYKETFVTPNHKYLLANINQEKLASNGYLSAIKDIAWKEICNADNTTALFPAKINFELKDTFLINLYKRSGGNWRTGYNYALDINLTPSYELGYIFGSFLGDGNSNTPYYKKSHRGFIKWYFGYSKDRAIKKLPLCVEKIFNKKLKVNNTKNTIIYTFNYKPFADFLKEFGSKENKQLPSSLLVNNPEYLKGIYDGLIDSDGNIEKKSDVITFSNTSIYLGELFSILSFLINGSLPVAYERKITTGLSNMNLENCKDSFAYKILKQPNRRIYNNKYILVKILKNETENNDIFEDVYDLEIDDDTHSFIANNCIVTGIGNPSISALQETSQINDVIICMDGGINSSGNFVKAIVAGADLCMAGSIFGKTFESPNDGSIFGMASRKLNEMMYTRIKSIEGIEKTVKKEYSLEQFVEEFSWGIKSAATYLDARNLYEIWLNGTFILK